jgi:hypothetical protein
MRNWNKPATLSLTVVCLLALASPASAADKSKIPSNADDHFVTKPTDGNKIDLGVSIEVDDEGYPTKKSQQALFDEIDYQGAVSAYLQSIPRMTMYGALVASKYYGATENTDIWLQYRDPSVDGMLTPNKVVTYIENYANLAETGPLVYEYPAGETAGIIMDIQMVWYQDMGLTSEVAGNQPVKYLVLTVDQQLPEGINRDKLDYSVVRVNTNQILFVYRNLDPVKNPDISKALKVYPYADRAKPKPNKFVQANKNDDTYFITPPIGMKYWERLNDLIQIERVREADRYMMARLKAVGIEKGKPFKPTSRQKAILERAALVGEKMAINISFVARSKAAAYRKDSNWVFPLTLNPSHRDGDIYQLEQGVDWGYEAYGVSSAMMAGIPGKGSTYLGAYRDDQGQWFEGENEYVFHIEPDAPAARFWDLSVYRLETRGLLPFKEGDVASVNTFTKNLKKNEDGSIDIYFGPGKAPEGFENNFINTTKSMRWFCYFRLYGPTKTYFDRSWKMNDIKQVK